MSSNITELITKINHKMLESSQWAIKKRIIACYPHITTRSIHLIANTSRAYVLMVLKDFGLKIKHTKEPGIID